MTESEWLACTEVQPMFEFLEHRASERKLQLFGPACCRRAWHLMDDSRHRHIVEVAERFANDGTTEAEMRQLIEPMRPLWLDGTEDAMAEWTDLRFLSGAMCHVTSGGGAYFAAGFVAKCLANQVGPADSPAWQAAIAHEEAIQCQILRDLIGNPYIPFHFEPGWLRAAGCRAVTLAAEIDRAGRFDSLSALGEVLARAGCRDRAVLQHCREPGPHVRGCWVVEALLGREGGLCEWLLTDEDWQSCGDPEPMLHYLHGQGSEQQWRQFAVACCHRIEHLLEDERSRRAVAVAARFADGQASPDELAAARRDAEAATVAARRAEYVAEADANFEITRDYLIACRRLWAACAARNVVGSLSEIYSVTPEFCGFGEILGCHTTAMFASVDHARIECGGEHADDWLRGSRSAGDATKEAERKAQCDLLRDIFGGYFGPVGTAGDWLYISDHTARSKYQRWCRLPTRRGHAHSGKNF